MTALERRAAFNKIPKSIANQPRLPRQHQENGPKPYGNSNVINWEASPLNTRRRTIFPSGSDEIN